MTDITVHIIILHKRKGEKKTMFINHTATISISYTTAEHMASFPLHGN
jgi:hypothetical protein